MAGPPPLEYDDFGLPIRRFEPPPVEEEPDAEPEKDGKGGSGKGSVKTDGISLRVDGESSKSNRESPKSDGKNTDKMSPQTDDASPTSDKRPGGEKAETEKSSTPDGEIQSDERGPNNGEKDVSSTKQHDLHARGSSMSKLASEFSHQSLTTHEEEKSNDDDGGWQTMPAFAPYDIYDDDNRLVAREHNDGDDDQTYGYTGLGGAGKGYTRVIMDEDAQSATSMDDNTNYLFLEGVGTSALDDEEQQRDAASQMHATKNMLTEGQKIAYVGLTRLEISEMVKASEKLEYSRSTKKQVVMSAEGYKMWGQKMMIRLYSHMDINTAEQIMIEQLGQHGVAPKDLTPVLMANARVKNPMASSASDRDSDTSSLRSPAPTIKSPQSSTYRNQMHDHDHDDHDEPLPEYEAGDTKAMTGDVKTPSSMPTTSNIDIDIRWTVLCDLFLVLISDSIYDARSRELLQRVGQSLEIPWVDICRFEKKVTDALEMQQQAEKENWNEDEHMDNRRKLALRRRYVMMGLATLGGGLVIGLSAGLLAPVIGAGLAAGFTTIGVAGTNGFLAGSAGAAIITSSAAASGSFIGGKAAHRRTGAVQTFEYRPLHNNKRVNLVVTVSGWLTGKVDDVRLPFSTVDPIMGDLYSILWEPEILRSIGDTINILATEALTQGLQQVLGNTILMSLMAALQLPVVLTKLSYLIDNPWAVSLDRATAAGLILADSLIDRNLGTRPVTLVGYSLGSRVIFSCLQELARKGAYGLVQNVYLFGSPVVVNRDQYIRVRTVVSGRFVNAYNRNDWILGYLFRLTNGGIRRVAGLAPIEEPWIENVDVTELVNGHMDYRAKMPRLLRECGWMVESDEFTEIEDPDPDNHQERQRELINEIEEARKDLENKPQSKSGGGVFGFLSRKKRTEKQEWEVYGDESKAKSEGDVGRKEGDNPNVLFDVDAIRAELSRDMRPEDLSVREMPSTLPPMRLDMRAPTESTSPPRNCSHSNAPGRTSYESRASDYTPSMPHARRTTSASYYNAQESAEDEIQMSFEPAPAPALRPPYAPQQQNRIPSYGSSYSDIFGTQHHTHGPTTLETHDENGAKAGAQFSIPDPWADLDDDDFGKEQEIQMTFA